MPVDATRRIEVARLRGRSEPLIRRGALLLEDALRTASLPDTESGRLLLIRSLPLGVIHLDRSAALVAHQLERQIAALAQCAVHGDDPRAPSAPAVYFHDRLDAVLTLIRRMARGPAGDCGRAWYWRQAVPGWQADLMPEQAGRLLLGRLLDLDPASRSFSQALQSLFETDSVDVLLQAVRAQDGPVLLRRCGWHDVDGVRQSATIRPTAVSDWPFPRTWRRVLNRWVTRWGAADVRCLWLMAVALQSWRGETARPSEVLGEATMLLDMPTCIDEGSSASSSLSQQPVPNAIEEVARVGRTDETTDPEATVQGGTQVFSTAHAGFWFLIPLLLRTGFGRAIQDHPEWVDEQVPWHLLRSLSDRLAIQPDDPLWLWLSDNDSHGALSEESDQAEYPSSEAMAVVGLWRIAIRRWCRLHAHLGLANLVRRPGRVSWSKTHVEVRMPLSHVDLRIRRAGLDLDPGWVPWLGRVVRFYFDAERRPHGAGGTTGR